MINKIQLSYPPLVSVLSTEPNEVEHHSGEEVFFPAAHFGTGKSLIGSFLSKEHRKSLNTVTAVISHLSKVQKLLKKKGKRSAIVSLKLSYAFALLEFLKTGGNANHKGRLGSYIHFKTAPSHSVHMLIEETSNREVQSFCRSLASEVFTYSGMATFATLRERRYNSSNS